MISDELRPIIEGLLTKTKQDQVNWIRAADLGLGAGDEDVVVSFPDFAVNVFRSTGDGGLPTVTFSILDSRGTAVDWAVVEAIEPGYDMLDELMRHASRQVSGADKILATLRDALAQPGRVGVSNPKPGNKFPSDDDLPF